MQNSIDVMENTMIQDLTSQIQTIDDFLLKGEPSSSKVNTSIAIISRSSRRRHLTLCNLENGFQEDAPGAIEALLRLRLLFEDQLELSSTLINKLLGVRLLYQFIKEYLLRLTDPQEFETRFAALIRGCKSEEISLMAHRLAFLLALYDPSKPDDLVSQQTEITGACAKLMERLEQHWRSILG